MNSVNIRVATFTGLGFCIGAALTAGIVVALAQVLSLAGPQSLPMVWIGFGVLLLATSGLLSSLLDKGWRLRVFGALVAVLALILAALASQSQIIPSSTFWIVATLVAFLWLEQTVTTALYALVAEHVVAAHLNRALRSIAIGLAAGSGVGGAYIALVAATSAHPLTISPVLVILAPLLVTVLIFSLGVTPVAEVEPVPAAERGLSLAHWRVMVDRIPLFAWIVASLALGSGLLTLIEYQALNVIAVQSTSPQDVMITLGWVLGSLKALGLALSIALTQPVLKTGGVDRAVFLNPMVLAVASIALSIPATLVAAIAVILLCTASVQGIAQPVFATVLGAVPRRYLHRIRLLSDHVLYPLTMIVAGAVIWVLQQFNEPLIFIVLGFFLSALAAWCALNLRTMYSEALLAQIKTGNIDFDRSGIDAAKVVRANAAEVRALLGSNDGAHQALGLELAMRGEAHTFHQDVEDMLSRAIAPVRSSFVASTGRGFGAVVAAEVESLLASQSSVVRALALEALVVNRHQLPVARLQQFTEDPSADVCAVAVVATVQAGGDLETANVALLKLPPEAISRAISTIAKTKDPRCVGVLRALYPMTSDNAALRAEVISASGALASTSLLARDDVEMFQGWAAEACRASYPLLLRAGAEVVRHLAIGDGPQILIRLMSHPLRQVRSSAAVAIAEYGASAIPKLGAILGSDDALVRETVIEAIGAIGGAEADDLLYRNMLSRHFAVTQRNLKWLALLPENPEWRVLEAALVDGNERALKACLDTLTALGYRQTLSAVRAILTSPTAQRHAQAVGALGALAHRKFVLPLVPLLEVGVFGASRNRSPGDTYDLDVIIQSCVRDRDRWAQIGAVLAAHHTGRAALLAGLKQTADPLVRLVINEVEQSSEKESLTMSRLMFLKTIPLFEGLSLDDILSVDEIMTRNEFGAGETIVAQGDPGVSLFVLYSGNAEVRLGQGAAAKLITELQAGAYFGEMTLFDDQPRSASVVAKTDCTLLSLDRDRFRTLVAQRPVVLMQICKTFGARLRETNRQLLAS